MKDNWKKIVFRRRLFSQSSAIHLLSLM